MSIPLSAVIDVEKRPSRILDEVELVTLLTVALPMNNVPVLTVTLDPTTIDVVALAVAALTDVALTDNAIIAAALTTVEFALNAPPLITINPAVVVVLPKVLDTKKEAVLIATLSPTTIDVVALAVAALTDVALTDDAITAPATTADEFALNAPRLRVIKPGVILVLAIEFANSIDPAVVVVFTVAVPTNIVVVLTVTLAPAVKEVDAIAAALTTVEFAVNDPLTVRPFLTTKLISGISVPYPGDCFFVFIIR